jgi:hypothetical protein
METSLHRQLKQIYAGEDAATEVRLGRWRIDAVCDGELIEIQHGSLSAIRDKIQQLCQNNRVRVVKPIVAEKTLVKYAERGGEPLESRRSPKRGRLLDVFDELVYFTRAFPHRRLTLELALVDVAEHRFPGHGRRRRWRRDDFQVQDQQLLVVRDTFTLRTAADLLKLLGVELPAPFDTGELARALGVQRSLAQRIAYCLREMGAVKQKGKRGNAWLYTPVVKRQRAKVGGNAATRRAS